MASKSALLLCFNLLFFTVVTSTYVPCAAPPPKSPEHSPVPAKPPSHSSPPPPVPAKPPSPSSAPPPVPAKPPSPSSPPPPVPATPPSPSSPPPGNQASCPMDALKLGVCANVLGVVNVTVGSPPTLPCCTLIQGLADLEAAVCLCTAIKASVLGINLNIPFALSLILNSCGKNVPREFQCA